VSCRVSWARSAEPAALSTGRTTAREIDTADEGA
jgi:hypothetical protein